MRKSILLAFNDSTSSWAVLDFLTSLSLKPEDYHITLFHILRKPSASEELMGKKFVREVSTRLSGALNKAKDKLVEYGFCPDRIEIHMVSDPYPTVADGIIDQCNKRPFDMVVIGRKRMSKAEEFVMGDSSVKLIRALEGTAVLVVKSGWKPHQTSSENL